MSEINFNQPLRLVPTIRNYLWGRVGTDSVISSLISPQQRERGWENKRFAELWYGAYPAFSSDAQQGGKSYNLHELITKYPNEILGAAVAEKFQNQFPFLFKILSINTPLSIQSHPDKKTAKMIHALYPEHYRDSNHKPEMIIALTPTEVLYGFRHLEDIRRNISAVPELRRLLSTVSGFSWEQVVSFSDAEEEKAIEYIYRGLYGARSRVVEKCCHDLFLRLEDLDLEELTPQYNWILRLSSVFPDGDVGIFAFFIHNLVKLNAGDMLYVEPNTVHSYLGGETLEISAGSDNTIRGGLTAKYVDKENLLKSISYKSFAGRDMISAKYDENEKSFKSFITPAQEFKVRCIEPYHSNMAGGGSENEAGRVIREDLKRGTPVLVFCLEGCSTFCIGNRGYSLEEGEACLLPAGLEGFELGHGNSTTYYISVPI